MKNIKPLYRYIIVTASYLLVSAVFFAAGYFIGHRAAPAPIAAANAPAAAFEEESAAPQALPEAQYRIILEDGELRLYSDEAGVSRLISAEPISEGSFPARDVALLKEGFVFETAEQALAMMENFLS